MAEEKFPHIFLQNLAETVLYTSHSGGGGNARIPTRNIQEHGSKLLRELNNAWEIAKEAQEKRSAVSLPTRDGVYLEFRSQAGYDLIAKSLEDLGQKVRLLNIKKEGEDESEVTIATVYVPAGKEAHFLKKITKYAEESKNQSLTNSIEDIRLAVLESFWQDNTELIPRQSKQWCEVWLRTTKENEPEIEENFRALCVASEIECRDGSLKFPERIVLLVKAQETDLTELIESSSFVAEFRLSKETAGFWVEMPNDEQSEWVKDLLDRVTVNDSNISLCVLDTGVNNGHPLLEVVLANDNCHTLDPDWGTHDDHAQGHGTAMCGVAAFGDLQNFLISESPLEINHKLESVKILPKGSQENPRELWGYLTSQAISRVEIKNPENLRINCMAVTSEDARDQGKPSSWSAAVDALMAGYEDDIKRLFIISAGNIQDSNEWINYPASNETNAVHDPGQSWNALTVGAITYKTGINDPDFSSYSVIAPYGGLSPFSTTSLTWERKWPIKPEIVLEGGNVGKDGNDFVTEIDDLSVLTTNHEILKRHFSVINATSASTAEASRMAAVIQASYPDAWPETIRGLMVHSARWTDELKKQFGIKVDSKKTDYANLLRICGYGIPDLERALYCAGNSLTLIAQETIQPYDKIKKVKGSGYKHITKDMHFYELPWPKDVLLELGNLDVQLRATLSYFIEPGPGEIGWKDRYRYPSHGLRFDLNSENETREQFENRLNAAANEVKDGLSSESGSERWTIGKTARDVGSIHSDIWEGSAAEIATCNMIGVYPIIGWWRERSYLDRYANKTRYSLIVSLHTPDQEVDIYTPVAIPLKIPISIKTK